MDTSVLLVEPFYGGSHRQLIDLLYDDIPACTRFTLPAKKWHWRARTAALQFSQTIPRSDSYRLLFCSSVLNLAELAALRPDLGRLRKVVYFHENQLMYPVRKSQDRDFQYGYNQVLTCLVADVVIFNSCFNMTSFLDNIASFMKLIPDHRPRGLADQIRPKCRIVHFPIQFPDWCRDDVPRTKPTCLTLMKQSNVNRTVCDSNDGDTSSETQCNKELQQQLHLVEGSDITDSATRPLHIVWPHRWEHDKSPNAFFLTLYKLQKQGLSFKVSVLGETYTDVLDIFAEAAEKLKSHIVAWGFQSFKDDYYRHLVAADVVVSTAAHEFFGVAMLEAVYLGCYPLCPRRLVYPEIFPDECLYNTDHQLLKRLVQYCKRPALVRRSTLKMDLDQYSWQRLRPVYQTLLTPQPDNVDQVEAAPSPVLSAV
ncbi:Glycosyltransferase-like domain-containing protein 1 [Lamellibrachia satsuma]|nr:Glycosyltransferase-like domain-containing protein 1 [Lamellibrachia satsuma]